MASVTNVEGYIIASYSRAVNKNLVPAKKFSRINFVQFGGSRRLLLV
jgi:hypothetical protein